MICIVLLSGIFIAQVFCSQGNHSSIVLAIHWIHQNVGPNVTRHYSRENPRENNSHYIKDIIYRLAMDRQYFGGQQYAHHLKSFAQKFQFLRLKLRLTSDIFYFFWLYPNVKALVVCNVVQCSVISDQMLATNFIYKINER